jgi:hypothetical protein
MVQAVLAPTVRVLPEATDSVPAPATVATVQDPLTTTASVYAGETEIVPAPSTALNGRLMLAATVSVTLTLIVSAGVGFDTSTDWRNWPAGATVPVPTMVVFAATVVEGRTGETYETATDHPARTEPLA